MSKDGLLINPMALTAQLRAGVSGTLIHEDRHLLLDLIGDEADNIWFVSDDGEALSGGGVLAKDLARYGRRYSIQEAQASASEAEAQAARLFDAFHAALPSSARFASHEHGGSAAADRADYALIFARSSARNLERALKDGPMPSKGVKTGFVAADDLIHGFDPDIPEKLARFPEIAGRALDKQRRLEASLTRLRAEVGGLDRLQILLEDEPALRASLLALPSELRRRRAVRTLSAGLASVAPRAQARAAKEFLEACRGRLWRKPDCSQARFASVAAGLAR